MVTLWHLLAFGLGFLSGMGALVAIACVVAPCLPNWGGE